MKYILLSLLSICSFIHLSAQDTFSIIAADPVTGEVGAAGATCVDGIAQWGGIQLLNEIIPGKGGVNAQAFICLNPHINLDLGIQAMESGMSPEEIIEWLRMNDGCNSGNFNPEFRQYGIVDFDADMNVRTTAFTGNLTSDYKNHIIGPTYAIQGNILIGQQVLDGMEDGFNNTEGSLAQKLMGAMQGANIPGADQRCLARGTSSTSAFLRVVKPEDVFGQHYLELSILEMPFGQEPIDSLQILFDNFLESTTSTETVLQNTSISIIPNPSNQFIHFKTSDQLDVEQVNFYNNQGHLISSRKVNDIVTEQMDVSNLSQGIYFVELTSKSITPIVLKFVKM